MAITGQAMASIRKVRAFCVIGWRFGAWSFESGFIDCKLQVHRKCRAGLEPMLPHGRHKCIGIRRLPEPLGDLMRPGSLIFVTHAVKQPIEGMETGKHLFWSAEIQIAERTAEETRWAPLPDHAYWGLQALQTVWGFPLERSGSSDLKAAIPETNPYARPVTTKTSIEVDKSVIAGAHLWIDPTLDGFLCCFSQAFVAKARRRKIDLPKFCRLEKI